MACVDALIHSFSGNLYDGVADFQSPSFFLKTSEVNII